MLINPGRVNTAIARVARLEADRNVPGLIQELDNPLGSGYSTVRLHALCACKRFLDTWDART
jgi:hypothetical protein